MTHIPLHFYVTYVDGERHLVWWNHKTEEWQPQPSDDCRRTDLTQASADLDAIPADDPHRSDARVSDERGHPVNMEVFFVATYANDHEEYWNSTSQEWQDESSGCCFPTLELASEELSKRLGIPGFEAAVVVSKVIA